MPDRPGADPDGFADGEVSGYLVEGASPRVRGRLGLGGATWIPLPDDGLLRTDGPPFPLPRGVIGAGCGFAFVLGRTVPTDDAPFTRAVLAGALVTCHVAIGVYGRATGRAARPGTADAALHASVRLGPSIAGWQGRDLAGADLRVFLDGSFVVEGERDSDPLDAVRWLAETLTARERPLEAGQVVATGSRIGILQVLPGQLMTVEAGALGSLALRLA